LHSPGRQPARFIGAEQPALLDYWHLETTIDELPARLRPIKAWCGEPSATLPWSRTRAGFAALGPS
jgi:hypothetical protein